MAQVSLERGLIHIYLTREEAANYGFNAKEATWIRKRREYSGNVEFTVSCIDLGVNSACEEAVAWIPPVRTSQGSPASPAPSTPRPPGSRDFSMRDVFTPVLNGPNTIDPTVEANNMPLLEITPSETSTTD